MKPRILEQQRREQRRARARQAGDEVKSRFQVIRQMTMRSPSFALLRNDAARFVTA